MTHSSTMLLVTDAEMRAEAARKLGIALKDLREAAKLTTVQLGDKVGVHNSHIGRIERGEARPSKALFGKIVDALDGKRAALLPMLLAAKGFEDEGSALVADPQTPYVARPSRKEGYLPVVGKAACGEWIEAINEGRDPTGEESWEKIAGDPVLAKRGAFFVEASGDSMTGPTPSGAVINDGDLLLVDPSARLVNGRVALVRLNNKVTVKVWREFGDQILLLPTNPKFKDMPISKEEFARDGVALLITHVQPRIKPL